MDTDTVPEIRDDRYAIHVQGLTRVFGSLIAVDNIDLDIKKGELFAMLGPNGAGKTTTIKMLCCLLKPTGGSATIMGHDINRGQYEIKKIIGVSPQETTISEHLNAREHLQLIGKVHGIESSELKNRSDLLLETMGLTERAKDQVRKYSGGMMRRLSIIMSLIHDPDIVFLDEPTLGLDPQARRAIWEYIAEFKGKKTILLTTHYLEEADFLSDRIGIMDEGKIVALGSSTELKTNMLGKHTMIVYAWNLTEKVISEMKEKYDGVVVTNGTMEITHPELDFKEVVDRLHSAGATVRSAYVKEPSLDDVFLSITGKEIRE
ncbi:MAG: ATP-binding cassette domain-containing protein [Dehalococcoidales bacterium]|nr:MAG: ATP-binding cassette domain-containing protein [Dehalococcoidales bacterium]